MMDIKNIDQYRTPLAILILVSIIAVAHIMSTQIAYAAACVSSPVSSASLNLDTVKT